MPGPPAQTRTLALLALLGAAVVALGPAALAQPSAPVRLEARVLDAASGEGLPGATAQVDGTDRGAAAGPDGLVRLDLPALPARLVVRFVGYAPATLVLQAGEGGADGVVRRTVRLEPSPAALGEAVVFAEDPGDRLWRRVQARRAALARRVGAYSAEVYSRLLLSRRGSLEREPVPVRFSEALSNVSWRAGGGAREGVVARWRTPEGGPYLYADMEAFPDPFFEDVLTLDGRQYVGPFHPEALRHYRFRIGETVEEGGRRFVDLAVLPRGAGGLSGRIRIVDSLFVLAETELRARSSGPVPITGKEASYRTWHAPAPPGRIGGDSLWLPRHFERTGEVDAGAARVRLPTVFFEQRAVATLVVPGVVGDLVLWRQAVRYHSPAGAYAGRGVYAEGRGLLPLGPAEARAERALGSVPLGRLLFREGILRNYVPIPVEGRDPD